MTIPIIGSGFSSLAAAAYLAKAGHDVHIFEALPTIGGRARQLKRDGFLFDMGPTWYWMPDVFERFFGDFGHKVSDFYTLERLDPAYSAYFGKDDKITVGSNPEEIIQTFEQIESGSGEALRKFLKLAEENYNIAVKDLVYRPGLSPFELVTPQTIAKLPHLLGNIKAQVAKRIKHPKLRQLLEFPVLFLGAKPSNTPALYNFMNWADFGLGTWHPKGGMYMVIEGMKELAMSMGVKIHTNAKVEQIITNGNKEIEGLKVAGEKLHFSTVLSGADYHHTETLLKSQERQYSEKFWDRKTFAPSALLYYIGFNKKLKNVHHHTLFFDTSFDAHAKTIYDDLSWPDEPMFYASFPSITDDSFAPNGCEAATFLIPLAPGLEDSQEIQEKYFDMIMTRLSKLTGQEITQHILFKETFGIKDFKQDYNSYKGNAYGLANILTQTAYLRPRIRSNKVKNLYFTGQLTVPGPGVPPSLISGKIVAEQMLKEI